MILLCPLCGDADDVVRTPTGPGSWRYTCSRTCQRHPGGTAYTWTGTDLAAIRTREYSGLVDELGVPADLLACLRAGDPWVEYGIVEHRYSQLRPANYQQLVDRYGHRRLSRDNAGGSAEQTASWYMSQALSRMSRTGEVCLQFGPATGCWGSTPRISYWALSPAPPLEHKLTYASFADREGLDLARLSGSGATAGIGAGGPT
jgi:hypothetical protein